MATKDCPFDQSAMSTLSGEKASTILLEMLVSPNSMMFNAAKGSMLTNPNGNVLKCGDCGFIAIFRP